MRYVHIKTDGFSADALHFTEMPARRVLGIYALQHEGKKALALFQLVRTAITDPKRQDEFHALSYSQAVDAINAWFAADYVELEAIDDTLRPG